MADALSDTARRTASFSAGHAVVIGVANYTNVAPLPEAVLNDARDVAAVLQSNAYCGYQSDNVHLLLDDDATLSRVRSALASVAQASGPDDSVVIFFSGHGARLGDPAAESESILLPVEFDWRRLATTSLSETEFSSALRQISAQRLLVLIDACHSGGVGSFKGWCVGGGPTRGFSEKSLGRLAQGSGRVLIASSRASEESTVFSEARNSVFTSHLLDVLRGRGRTSGDGVIRVFEIFNHVAEMVKREVPGRQHPIFKASDLEDNFPVALNRGGAKSDSSAPVSETEPEVWGQLADLLPVLFPAGPMDQEVWARAGGDPSRLHLGDTGRAAWFRALRALRQGGGGPGIRRESLIGTALEDYPHHPVLVALL